MKVRVAARFQELQRMICRELEALDGQGHFESDPWSSDGGGGDTRVIQNGHVFEKGGVNFSNVSGTLNERISEKLSIPPQGFHAAGISLVIHPRSPMIPAVHFNLRYFELADGDRWFGGGMDLTPYYLDEEDAHHFHKILRSVCDRHDSSYYPRFKQSCDEYFFLKHRGEARGIGGIFFDYLRNNAEQAYEFAQDLGESFLHAYTPIVKKNKGLPWGTEETEWQLQRRGRYAEFNLIYDRGTLFGLETDGRAESILISLPPAAKWSYNVQPKPGSREAALVEVLRKPRDWAVS
jgi:coproporphyrinogen III oxidase